MEGTKVIIGEELPSREKWLRTLPLKEIFSNSGARGFLKLAKESLWNCVHSDDECPRSLEMQFELPTRLIDVEDETRDPSLYESGG